MTEIRRPENRTRAQREGLSRSGLAGRGWTTRVEAVEDDRFTVFEIQEDEDVSTLDSFTVIAL